MKPTTSMRGGGRAAGRPLRLLCAVERRLSTEAENRRLRVACRYLNRRYKEMIPCLLQAPTWGMTADIRRNRVRCDSAEIRVYPPVPHYSVPFLISEMPDPKRQRWLREDLCKFAMEDWPKRLEVALRRALGLPSQ